MEYVNVPRAQSTPPISANDKRLVRLVVLSFGLLCVLQATLNVSLRIYLYNSDAKTSELDGICKNFTDQKRNNFDEYFRTGWVYFNTSLYYISTVKKNWLESQVSCLHMGAELMVINSRDEQEFTRKFHRFMWIGLRRRRGVWFWVDGTPLTTSYWASGEPNMGENENCVELRVFEEPNSWNDIICENQNYWICEKKMSL